MGNLGKMQVIEKLKCSACEREWFPRRPAQIPKKCPRCQAFDTMGLAEPCPALDDLIVIVNRGSKNQKQEAIGALMAIRMEIKDVKGVSDQAVSRRRTNVSTARG